MSAFSETVAEIEASKLARILRKGIESNNKSVIKFLKKEVYPLYRENIDETFGSYDEDEDIRAAYRD